MPVSAEDVDALLAAPPEPKGVTPDQVDQLLAEPAPAEPLTTKVTFAEPLNLGDNGALQPSMVNLGKPGEVTTTEKPVEYSLTAKQADRAARVAGVFHAAGTAATEEELGVRKLSAETGVPIATLKPKYAEISHAWAASKFDPVRFDVEYPELAKLVFDHPELGKRVFRDEQISNLHQALDYARDHDLPFFLALHPDLAGADTATVREAFAADIAQRNTRKRVALTEDAEAKKLQEGYTVYGQGLVVPNRVLVPIRRFEESWKQMQLSKLQYELGRRRHLGEDTTDLEERVLDASQAAVRRDYNEGPVEQVFTDVAEVGASSVAGLEEALKVGGAAGAGAGTAAGLTTLAVTKSPGLAAQAFGRTALSWGSVFGKAGAFYGSLQLETGSAYGDMLEHGIEEPTAWTAANIYGVLAAGIETASWGPMMKNLGPGGALLKEGSTQAFTKALLTNPGFRITIKNLALEAGAEGGEEFLQDATQQAIEYFARGRTGPFVEVGQSIDAGAKGLVGAGGMAVTHAGIGVATHGIFADRARDSASAMEVLAAFGDSETLQEDPEAVAEMVRRLVPDAKNVYVEPNAFLKFHQLQKQDPAAAATSLLGEHGPRLLQEAIAAGTPLEVPLERYMGKWSGTEAAKALAPNSTLDPKLPPPHAIDTAEVQKEAEKLAEAFAKGGQAAEPETEGEALFVSVTEQQLAQVTGDPERARQQTELFRAMVRTQTRRWQEAGVAVDASELFKKFSVLVSHGLNPTARDVLEMRANDGKLSRVEELYRDENTGLPNEVAYAETPLPAGAQHTVLSVEGIKWLNDTVHHSRADLLYRAVAQALHAKGIKAHKVGGDFAFHARSEAQLEQLGAAVREALPADLRGFGITTAVGPTLEHAQKAAEVRNADLVQKGERANPRPLHPTLKDEFGEPVVLEAQRPKGLGAVDPANVRFPTTKAGAAIAPELAARATSLKPADYFSKAYVDPATGAWTRRAWNAMPRRKHAAMLDLKGLRFINKKFGKVGGDEFIRRVGWAAKEAGGESFDFAHLQGDEFAAQHDDLTRLQGFVDDVRELLERNPLQFEKAGSLTTVPIAFHDGFGADLKAADTELNAGKKARRTAREAGLAVERGRRTRPGSAGVREEDRAAVRAQEDPLGPEAVARALYAAPLKPGEGPRGYTKIFDEGMQRIYRVVLNQNADLSTFLHESAHVFLDIVGALAEREDAPQRAKDDWKATLKWLGAKTTDDLVPTSALESDPARMRHEKWAKGFERYLAEGQAPSEKLAGAFANFRLWMAKVYRKLLALDQPINDEIRGVFDRLLATDREIDSYKKRMGAAKPLSRDSLGMTPEQFIKHVDESIAVTSDATRAADRRVLKDVHRNTEAWWRDELKEHRDQAEADYEKLPARQVQNALFDRGDPRIGPLDYAKVKEVVGDKLVKRVRAKSGGADPEPVAVFFGYPTVKAMLDDYLQLPEKAQWSREQADARMREKYPELLDQRQQLQDLVGRQLHGPRQERFLRRELAALMVKASVPGENVWASQLPPIEAEKQAAKLIVEGTPVGRLDVGGALQAERRAADHALLAAERGNAPHALAYYRQRMLNFFRWKQLLDARALRESFLELAAELLHPKARGRLGKASPTYLTANDAALELLGMKERGPDTKLNLEAVVLQLEQDGQVAWLDPAVVQPIVDKLAAYNGQARAYTTLTVAELRTMKDLLSGMKAAATNASTVLSNGKKLDKEERIALHLKAGEALSKLPPPNTPGAESLPEWFGGVANSIGAWTLKPETMLNWLAGDDIHSPIYTDYVQPLVDAKHKETDLLRGVIQPLVKLFDRVPKAKMSQRIDGAELFKGHTEKFAAPKRRWEFLVMLLNMGNESNKHRLLEGRGLSEQQVWDAALKLGITKEEYDWVQGVWDAAEALKEPAFALEQEDTGIRPEEIEATPISTPFGQYRGGYFPAVYVPSSATGERQGVSQFTDPSYIAMGTARGHLKSRAEDFADIISLSPVHIYKHLAQVAHDIAFRQPIRSVGGLVLNDKIRQMLVDRLGEERAATFRQWLTDIGQQRGLEQGALGSGYRYLRTAMSAFALGGVIPNVLEDVVTGLVGTVAATDLKAAHLTAGVAALIRHPKQALGAAEAESGELRSRRGQMSRELLSQVSQMIARTPLGRGPLRFLKDHAFAMQEVADRFVSAAIYIGIKRQLLDGNANPTAEELADVTEKANKLVRLVMPSHHVVDSAKILRDKGFLGTSVVFYSFMNTALNVVRATQGRDVLSAKSAKASGRVMGYMLSVFILGSLVRGQGPDADEPWEQWFLRKMGTGFAGMFPWAGDVSEMMFADFQGKKRAPRNNSAAGMVAAIYEMLMKAADGDKDAGARLDALLRGISLSTGLPAGQLLRTLRYLYDLEEGDVDPRGAGDVAGGLIYGQRANGQGANVFTLGQDIASGPSGIEGSLQSVVDHPGPQ